VGGTNRPHSAGRNAPFGVLWVSQVLEKLKEKTLDSCDVWSAATFDIFLYFFSFGRTATL